MKSLTRRRYIGLLFISPWIIGFLVLQLYPFITSLIYSFAEYNIMSSPKFIGIQNYVQLLTRDREFWNSLRVTVIYTLFTVPGKLVVALLVAVLMNKNMRGVNAIRTIYYLPSLFGGSIAVSILWKLMFQNTGIINQIIGLVGVQPVKWLGNPNTAMPVIIMLNLWQFGSAFVMFLAALKNVPGELYEAAEIDGANRVVQFFRITLPQISSIIFFNIIMQTITALQSFTGPMVITNGGPLKATYVLGLKLYTEAFSYYKMGYACAISWVIFILIMAVTGVLFRFSSMVVYYEDKGDF
ncbi:MAG: sugar ABC transporter permease [Oscillospiraceae bacterium]|nr:sugar ABC transporter permease [Oscillospiraceae bacterium]